MKSTDKPSTDEEVNATVFQYKVHYKINGIKYYVLVVDPEHLLNRIKYEEEFKTYRTRII